MPILALITLVSLGITAYMVKQRNDLLQGITDLTIKDQELTEREIAQRVKEYLTKEEKRIREDAIKNSRSTIRGQSVEKYISLHESFKQFNPSDARFLGSPIDYVIFNGVSDILDGKKDTQVSVTMLDIKTNKARLTKAQQKIKEAIEANRVEWKTIQLSPS